MTTTPSNTYVAEQVVKLYHKTTFPSEIRNIFDTCYDPSARFQDAFADVRPRNQVLRQFLAMNKLFRDYKLADYRLEANDYENRVSIISTADYNICGFWVSLYQETKLFFNDNHKVVFHNDHFPRTFFETLDRTSGVRLVYTGARTLSGFIADKLLRLVV
jgi:hypothetical protein